MKKNVLVALGLAVLWLIAKVILKQFLEPADALVAGIFANMLLIMLAAFFGIAIAAKHRKEAVFFLEDFKQAAGGAAVYALALGACIFIYYQFIDPEFVERQIAEKVEMVRQMDWEADKPDQLEYQLMTHEEYIVASEASFRKLHSPWTQAVLSSAALLLLGIFYSFVLSILYRKVWSKFR